MSKFGYMAKREMDPRPGRKYSTEYYKQSRKERERTQQHVGNMLQQFGREALEDPEAMAAITAPMKKFPRKETKGYYSALDVITDLWEQMQSGKDIPSGMLGRWNRLFDGTGNEIDMIPEDQLPPTTNYKSLFGDQE